MLNLATYCPSQWFAQEAPLHGTVVSRVELWQHSVTRVAEFGKTWLQSLAKPGKSGVLPCPEESKSVNRYLRSEWEVERCPNFLILLYE